ncbi:transposable element Tcb1 transposase [Trichonephila clavipes]|nr:transposable element Tcb1 transposase [Trichonephila clavipes]
MVRHNDESVREGYIRNGGNEVKVFTSALKAFRCNNRLVMAQRNHLDDFYMVELLDDWNVDLSCWKYPRSPPNEDRYFTVTAKRNRRSIASDLSCQLSSSTGTTVSSQSVYRRLAHTVLYQG